MIKHFLQYKGGYVYIIMYRCIQGMKVNYALIQDYDTLGEETAAEEKVNNKQRTAKTPYVKIIL